MALFDRFKRGTPQPVETQKTVQSPAVQYRSTFMAAAANRLQNGWYKPLLSSNKELVNDLPIVRGLARYLSKNDVYTARYLELVQTNIVGPTGIQMVPRVMGDQGEFNTVTNEALKKGWEEWCKVAGLDGYSNFTDIEQLAVRTLAMDGEVFVRMVMGPKVNQFGFGLMLLDADQLDVNYNAVLSTGNTIVQGVEVNRYGMPEAFHFYTRHPSDINTAQPLTRERVPADEIIHLFKRNRVGQLRGYSWVAPAMYFLAKLHEYMDAEVVAAQAAASQIATIETPLNDVSGYQSGNSNLGPEVVSLEPGVMVRLAPGEKLNPWNSNHPNTAFGPFVETLLHGISSALNVSYSSLSSDSSKENYAGGRIGLLTERDYWKNQQTWFIRQFHEKVYAVWVQYALAFGGLDLPDTPEEYQTVEFRPRGFKWADPLRDIKAYESMIANNLISKGQVTNELGYDYKDVLDERYEEIKLEAEYRKYLEEEGLGQYINQLTAPSPAINEAQPTVDDMIEEEEVQETMNEQQTED